MHRSCWKVEPLSCETCMVVQEDKDLVHEFVNHGGLDCLISVGSAVDQNYQNYILRGSCEFLLLNSLFIFYHLVLIRSGLLHFMSVIFKLTELKPYRPM